jgi:beta-phosphoglucomutase-like phosphatase (HAD superfamily)
MSSRERWQRVADLLGLHSVEESVAVMLEFFSDDVLDTELVNCIRSMRGRYRIALLSNFTDSLPRLIENEYGLGDCFDAIIVSALVGRRKTDPAIYRLTL